MKKGLSVIFTLVIILTISIISINAATFSGVLYTYLVDGEFGTVISSDDVNFAINESQGGGSGAVIFTIPKVVSFVGDDGTQYRSPIVNSSFGKNIIKFQNGTDVIYSGPIENSAAYVNTLESGNNYVVTFSVSQWDLSNPFYEVWVGLNDYEGFIYVEVTVDTEKSTDEKIFEYLTGNYNSIEISKGNEEIGGALTAIEPLQTDLQDLGQELHGALHNTINRAENNISTFKTPVGKIVNLLGNSLSPIFNGNVVIFLISISVLSIVIIAILRKAGD